MNMLFVVALVVIAGLVFYFHKQTTQTLNQLKAVGFTVDQEIASNPRIVIDHQQKRLALIYAKHYELIEFSQIEFAEFQPLPGDDEDREYHRVVIHLKDHPKDKVKLRGRKIIIDDDFLDTINSLKDS